MEDIKKAVESVIEKVDAVCTFAENQVYVLIAIARPKNNSEITYGASDYHKGPAVFRMVLREDNKLSACTRMVSMIKGFEHDPIKPEDFNMYLTFNPRDTRKAFRTMQIYHSEWILNDDWERLKHYESKWFSCLQKKSARAEKKYYMVDIDNKKHATSTYVILGQLSDPESWIEMPSRNGFHILVPPFNVQKFKERIKENNLDVEVKTDDCVNLWCGNW